MNHKEAIEILKRHNEWRRGADIEPTNPIQLGQAIDVITQNNEKMTSSRFIDKWLGNPDKQYDEHNRMEMLDDLYDFADWCANTGNVLITNSGSEIDPKMEATRKIEYSDKELESITSNAKYIYDRGTLPRTMSLTYTWVEVILNLCKQAKSGSETQPKQEEKWINNILKDTELHIKQPKQEQSVTDCSQLKPCPFCGSEATLVMQNYAHCNTCKFTFNLDIWNKRACYTKKEMYDILTSMADRCTSKTGARWMRDEIKRRLTNSE